MSRMERGMHYLIIEEALNDLGEHEAPDREFEAVSYLIEFTLDYGAYREFKRHRMQTVMTQQPSPALGYTVPPLIQDAGLEEEFRNTMTMAEETHSLIDAKFPQAAPYVLTHAHHRRLITRVNLRECYHMLKLRTSPQAHAAIRGPMNEALKELRKVHPILFGTTPSGYPTPDPNRKQSWTKAQARTPQKIRTQTKNRVQSRKNERRSGSPSPP